MIKESIGIKLQKYRAPDYRVSYTLRKDTAALEIDATPLLKDAVSNFVACRTCESTRITKMQVNKNHRGIIKPNKKGHQTFRAHLLCCVDPLAATYTNRASTDIADMTMG